MPPKKKKGNEASKKNQQKKKEKLLDDKTFGLKNKNKSQKVRAEVQSYTKSILNQPSDGQQYKMDAKKKQEKLAKKALKKAKDAEKAALFDEALLAVSKKGTTKSGKVEAKGRDHGDDDKKKAGTSRAMKMMFQMDAQEMEDKLKEDPNYVPTLEDEIESQRQTKLKELAASGKKGTPITEASFKEWQDKKRKRKEAAIKKMVESEMRKKKGGKGLSVLSGKELYAYKKDLFKDQDGDDVVDVLAESKKTDGESMAAEGGMGNVAEVGVEAVAERVEKDLFLEGGDDDDLDDILDD